MYLNSVSSFLKIKINIQINAVYCLSPNTLQGFVICVCFLWRGEDTWRLLVLFMYHIYFPNAIRSATPHRRHKKEQEFVSLCAGAY